VAKVGVCLAQEAAAFKAFPSDTLIFEPVTYDSKVWMFESFLKQSSRRHRASQGRASDGLYIGPGGACLRVAADAGHLTRNGQTGELTRRVPSLSVPMIGRAPQTLDRIAEGDSLRSLAV
jgi:hypothetical protein